VSYRDSDHEGFSDSADGRDVAVRCPEPSLALLTVSVFIR